MPSTIIKVVQDTALFSEILAKRYYIEPISETFTSEHTQKALVFGFPSVKAILKMASTD